MVEKKPDNAFIGNFRPPAKRSAVTQTIEPKIAMLCEVEIKLNGNNPSLGYRRMKLVDLSGGDSESKFASLLKEISDDNATNSWDNVNLNSQGRHSDLSVGSEALSFVVFKLAGKKNGKWKFARFESPISVPDGSPEDASFEARRVNQNGDICDPAVSTANCQIAYFIANNDGFDQQDGDRNYLSFNLHVEIFSNKAGNSTFIPIIIDPDVGWPGGNRP